MKQKYLTYLSYLTLIFMITSCKTYTEQNGNVRNAMKTNNIAKAIEDIDKSDIANQERNYALFRMEKGMLLYLDNKYDDSIKLWLQADQKLDDLYTTSISNTTASMIVNDSMTDYEGEAHERILLPIFSSIAFYSNNNVNNAQVMIRRTYDIINHLSFSQQGKNTLKYDSFSHYFSAFVYESKGEWDNALIEYRSALNNLIAAEKTEKNSLNEAKEIILKALGRLAEYRNRTDILGQIKQISPNLKWENQEKFQSKSEVFIVYESGLSPIKVPETKTIPTGKTTVTISFPKYEIQPYKSHMANIFIHNQLVTQTVKMEDIGKMAVQALEDRRIKDMAKMITRVLAKTAAAQKLADHDDAASNLAGMALGFINSKTEVADTRSWTSLPDTIQIARITIEPNKETEIQIRPEADAVKSFSVKLNPGEKKLYRFRTFN
jgi:hypothetical protein